MTVVQIVATITWFVSVIVLGLLQAFNIIRIEEYGSCDDRAAGGEVIFYVFAPLVLLYYFGKWICR